MEGNLRDIVNGSMLPQFTGKKVSVTGLITSVNPNGLTFDMRTMDDVLVKVVMKKPIKDRLEGHAEVHGTAQQKTIVCEHLIQFPLEESANFDASGHNTLCTLWNSIPDLWKIAA